MMEAVRTSETSVNFNVTTRRYIPEDSKLHTRSRKNLKSHIVCAHVSVGCKLMYLVEKNLTHVLNLVLCGRMRSFYATFNMSTRNVINLLQEV
jgi:hypothetical protein